MYKLIGVSAKNFLSFKEFLVNLAKPGVWIVTGYNMLGGDSNGSGKSTIFSAISWCLYGRTSKGSVTDIGNWGGGVVEVEVSFSSPEGLVSVYRSPTKTEIRHDTGEVIGGNRFDVQKAINQLFKADYPMFINSTLWAQGSTEFLAASGDVDKKKLLKAIMGLEVLDKGSEKAKKVYDEAVTSADNLTIDIHRLEDNVSQAKAASIKYTEKIKGWTEEHDKAVDKLRAQVESVSKPDTTGAEEQLHEKDSIYQKMSQELEQHEKELEALTSMFSFKNQDQAVYRTAINDLTSTILKLVDKDGEMCPYCGSEITRKNLGKHKKELNTKLEEYKLKLHKAENETFSCQEDLDKCKSWLDSYGYLRSEIIQLSHQHEMDKSKTKSYDEITAVLKAKLREEEEATNPYTDLAGSYESDLADLHSRLNLAQEAKDTIVHKIDYIAYCRWLLSREGVSSYIIEQSFARLEHLTNFYLSKLSTEGFRVQIKPQRELKSKSLKEEIDIAVFTGKHHIPYWNLSDGQRQRLNIALLVAVYRLCRDYGQARFDFLLLDEVLDLSLGAKGQDDVLRFMKEMLAEISSIYVISHKETISSDFDHEVSVIRDTDGVSTIASHG